jgi:hypothetical protein
MAFGLERADDLAGGLHGDVPVLHHSRWDGIHSPLAFQASGNAGLRVQLVEQGDLVIRVILPQR